MAAREQDFHNICQLPLCMTPSQGAGCTAHVRGCKYAPMHCNNGCILKRDEGVICNTYHGAYHLTSTSLLSTGVCPDVRHNFSSSCC